MVNTEFKVALMKELLRLTRERGAIGEQMDLIRKLLGDEVGSPDAVKADTPVAEERPTHGEVETATIANRVPQKSVKQLVREVLMERPGVKSGVVTHVLRSRGLQTGGETHMSHRVYNEIWRMVKTGEAVRTKEGGFELVR